MKKAVKREKADIQEIRDVYKNKALEDMGRRMISRVSITGLPHFTAISIPDGETKAQRGEAISPTEGSCCLTAGLKRSLGDTTPATP